MALDAYTLVGRIVTARLEGKDTAKLDEGLCDQLSLRYPGDNKSAWPQLDRRIKKFINEFFEFCEGTDGEVGSTKK